MNFDGQLIVIFIKQDRINRIYMERVVIMIVTGSREVVDFSIGHYITEQLLSIEVNHGAVISDEPEGESDKLRRVGDIKSFPEISRYVFV